MKKIIQKKELIISDIFIDCFYCELNDQYNYLEKYQKSYEEVVNYIHNNFDFLCKKSLDNERVDTDVVGSKCYDYDNTFEEISIFDLFNNVLEEVIYQFFSDYSPSYTYEETN